MAGSPAQNDESFLSYLRAISHGGYTIASPPPDKLAQGQTSGARHASPSCGTQAARQNARLVRRWQRLLSLNAHFRVVGGVVGILAVHATPSGKGAVATGEAIGGISRAFVVRRGFMLGLSHVRIFTPAAAKGRSIRILALIIRSCMAPS